MVKPAKESLAGADAGALFIMQIRIAQEEFVGHLVVRLAKGSSINSLLLKLSDFDIKSL